MVGERLNTEHNNVRACVGQNESFWRKLWSEAKHAHKKRTHGRARSRSRRNTNAFVFGASVLLTLSLAAHFKLIKTGYKQLVFRAAQLLYMQYVRRNEYIRRIFYMQTMLNSRNPTSGRSSLFASRQASGGRDRLF